MESTPPPERGVRGFELNAHLTFARPLSRPDALEALRGWQLPPELYGSDDQIRAAFLSGELDRATVLALLRGGLEGGLLRAAELGRRGFLRSVTGTTEWVPWRRNVVVPRGELERVTLEDGLQYLVE
ncbi:hypothetical protein [Deinococcus sonorensis]|uniref:Uncharacterized protein n=2 Tax=Deinococcus sonorensis TaxID=309891 RepID=A0AAU7UBH3_9DEIO